MYTKMSQYEDLCNGSEKIHRLEIVSGYSIDQLISLFAAGCTLKRPEFHQESFDKYASKLALLGNGRLLNPEEKVVIAKFADENLGGKEHV